MEIRKATIKDLPDIMRIYEYARKVMKKNGNPTQWGDSYPELEMLQADIEKEALYVIMDYRQCGCSRKPQIVGVFAFYIGDDPTYDVIEDGAWPNDEVYGTIHRIAGGPTAKGLVGAAVDFGFNLVSNIRIDTHEDNSIMQHVIEKNGFSKCGRIYVADGSPRIAYQKVLDR